MEWCGRIKERRGKRVSEKLQSMEMKKYCSLCFKALKAAGGRRAKRSDDMRVCVSPENSSPTVGQMSRNS